MSNDKPGVEDSKFKLYFNKNDFAPNDPLGFKIRYMVHPILSDDEAIMLVNEKTFNIIKKNLKEKDEKIYSR